MKFFLDENFPKSAAGMLESLGHGVFDLRGTEREGSSEAEIFGEAQQRRAILLTTDRDFFHTIPHLFPHHEGVIIIALRQPNQAAILGRETEGQAKTQPESHSGHLVTVDIHQDENGKYYGFWYCPTILPRSNGSGHHDKDVESVYGINFANAKGSIATWVERHGKDSGGATSVMQQNE